jgi:phosphopantothenoylcysteine decarboxylase/phosphopantothenate--cysteine ligase
MLPLKGRRIALGVGGGIAAYKAVDLMRELQRAGAEVRVAMTAAAEKFITPLTFQSLSHHSVLTDLFDPSHELESKYGHLDLSRWADLFVLAPATGDLIARVRAGMANDAVTTSLLAFRGPVLLAPAMNVAMWENASTQENVRTLLAQPRFKQVGPGVGPLADGDVGAGRLAELPEIVAAAVSLAREGPLAGKQVLITAGPTREPIDPVRFISNPSTGKMGLAIAEVARARGAEVTVVLGPVPAVPGRDRLEVIDVVTAEEMARAVLERVELVDYFFAAAAVSDYRPSEVAAQKKKKGPGGETLNLVRTPDVLAEASARVAASRRVRRPVLVGFAAETEKLLEHAREKLQRKALDWIVANDVTQAWAGFGVDTNQVTAISRTGEEREISGSKQEVARQLWDLVHAWANKEGSSSGP